MARQTTGRGTKSEPPAEPGESVRSEQTDELWAAVRIDPVEIALPKGVGYTLRAYRPATEITPTDVSGREADLFPQRPAEPRQAEPTATQDGRFDEEGALDEDGASSEAHEFDDANSDTDNGDEADLAEEDSDEAAAAAEEVPVFLGRAGQVYLFRSTEGLVEFVRSAAEHDLSQVDTWPELVKRISAEDVVPLPEDTYELDLVVSNLRGGHDAWDAGLIIQAGEVARDLGYALRIDSVVNALATGSPLDDLDEALRAAESGGLGSFFARRKLKKIGAEAAPLGWRTIIGKISSAVDWRD